LDALVGVGVLGASSALAGPANGAAIMKATDETSQVVPVAAVAVAAGTVGRAEDAVPIERNNPQALRSLVAFSAKRKHPIG
jgi:hypothetical protein